jgi:hypothetical protein
LDLQQSSAKEHLVRKFNLFKVFILSIAFSLMTLFGGINTAHAGWSENIRLTYRGNEISPQVIARGDTVHVVWGETRTNSARVSYIRSTDGGNTWGSIIDLNDPGHPCPQSNPTLNLAERGILVSWFDYNSIEGFTSIGIRKSSNGGGTWSAPSYVGTDNPNHFGIPVSAVKGDSIFLVYFSDRNDSTGLSPFRSMHSYDYGATWSDEVTVGHPFILMPQPIIMKYCFGTLLLAWAGTADSSRRYEVHIYGYRSIDAGRSWSDTIWISPNSQYWSLDACLACDHLGYTLLTGYMDYRYQIYAFYGDIFASISDDGGLSWPFETQTTMHHTAAWPAFDVVQDTIIAVWDDIQFDVTGNPEVVFNRSNDGGQTWLGEIRLTETQGESGAAVLSMDRGKIHVVWGEVLESGAVDLFYKKYTPDSTDAIDESDISHPSNFSLSAYPNPFNSSITITVSSNEPGILDIYDIEGRIVRQYPFEKGNQRIVWDGRTSAKQPLTSGIYFIGRKGGEKNTLKVVYVK